MPVDSDNKVHLCSKEHQDVNTGIIYHVGTIIVKYLIELNYENR